MESGHTGAASAPDIHLFSLRGCDSATAVGTAQLVRLQGYSVFVLPLEAIPGKQMVATVQH